MSVSTTVVSTRSLLPSSTPSFTAASTTSSLMALSVAGVSRLKVRLKASCLGRSHRDSIGNAFAQLAIIPVLHPHQNQCAQHLRRSEAAASVVRLFEAAHQIAPHPLDQRRLLIG